MIPISDTMTSRHPPLAAVLLITANVTVFLLEVILPGPELEAAIYYFGLVPRRFADPIWAYTFGYPESLAPFVTSMFLHGGLLHLLLNMWSLWIFGDNVEERMGSLRFVIFYLICGVLAAVVHSALNPSSTIPVVGASGAIAGVMGAYFVMFPGARIIVLIPVFVWPFFIEVYAVLFMVVWFLGQFFSGVSTFGIDAGGVAWWAHVGGFLSGAILCRLFDRSRDWTVRYSSRRRRPLGMWR